MDASEDVGQREPFVSNGQCFSRPLLIFLGTKIFFVLESFVRGSLESCGEGAFFVRGFWLPPPPFSNRGTV